ncbi:MAG TPA: zf-HC2 domain-containing protein, partial [Actinomycetota bacterium]|nr:zf-HC2 domain-containing protein [Actinomycetota bacterium]
MTDCSRVRPLLAEHALGILEPAERGAVGAHLAWCAGCRKEARELAEGAAVVAQGIVPAEPPETLGPRILGTARRTPRGRGRRAFVGALAAAVLAMGAFGWAVAMTGRAEQLEAAARSAAERAERFEAVVAQLLLDAGEGRVLSARLEAVEGRSGGGRAVILDSPGGVD